MTAAAVASAFATSVPFFSGWNAKADPALPGDCFASHFSARESSASSADFPPFVTSAGFTPSARSAPSTTEVEFASDGEPAVYPQPPSLFCADFSHDSAFSASARCPPIAANAWIAAPVWFVSTWSFGPQSAAGFARYGAKEPSAHCCPTSQSTAFTGSFRPAASSATRDRDCRHTPSYVGSCVPKSPSAGPGEAAGVAAGAGAEASPSAPVATRGTATARRRRFMRAAPGGARLAGGAGISGPHHFSWRVVSAALAGRTPGRAPAPWCVRAAPAAARPDVLFVTSRTRCPTEATCR